MVKIWKVHIWKLQSFVLSGLDYVLIFVFFIFAQSSMKVDESITLFIFVSNYSCSIFALLWNVTTHNLMYFISMCSSMGLFFSFELNTQTFLMYLFQIKYIISMIQERAVKSLMSFYFNSFWDIYVQTSPQISMCKKTVQKWVDGPFSKKYILKSILYMKPLDNNIV